MEHSRLDECGYDNCVIHSFKVYFYLEDNCFTILCWFLPHYNVNQPQVDTCPLPFEGVSGGSVGTEICLQNAGDPGSILGNPLEKGMAPTPVFLPGKSPWTEEPGGLQSMGSQRVKHV